jgi:hypothetical protein
LISGLVTVSVVELLEVIQIHYEDRQKLIRSSRQVKHVGLPAAETSF